MAAGRGDGSRRRQCHQRASCGRIEGEEVPNMKMNRTQVAWLVSLVLVLGGRLGVEHLGEVTALVMEVAGYVTALSNKGLPGLLKSRPKEGETK